MKKIWISLVLLALALSACSARAGSELARNRDKWQAAGIGHYRFSLSVLCFCPFSAQMPLSVEVLNGRVVSMTYNDGTPVPEGEQANFSAYSTMDALITYTEDALRRADEIHITYDPLYGFPSQVQIDFIKNAVDDELALRAENFQALP
jgi:hypothetical protein